MPKISFNAQALGIASYHKHSNMGHAKAGGPRVALVRADTSIQSLFEGLGFTHVESFPVPRDNLPTEDLDP